MPRPGILLGEPSASYAGTRISRRGALRRLALLGIAAGASGPLLTACGTSPSAIPPAPPPAPPPPAPTDLPGRGPNTPIGRELSFPGPTGDLRGVWAAPVGELAGAVLVVHDIQGLTSHFSDMVGRFAGAGYAALCVDLMSGQDATAAFTDPTEAPMALASMATAKLVARLRAGIVELGRRAPGAMLGAVGFGYGGGALWRLLDAGDPVLAAVVSFYGVTPDDVDLRRSRAAILALYPGNDRKLSESQDNADMAMTRANLVRKSIAYPHTDAGFFNDTDTRYSPAAAARAWRSTTDWFSQHLARPPVQPNLVARASASPPVKGAKPS